MSRQTGRELFGFFLSLKFTPCSPIGYGAESVLVRHTGGIDCQAGMDQMKHQSSELLNNEQGQ